MTHTPNARPAWRFSALWRRWQVLENYMSLSEQLPSRLWLGANEQSAFGLLLQVMPGTSDQLATDDEEGRMLWEQVQALADTLTREEMLTLPPAQ